MQLGSPNLTNNVPREVLAFHLFCGHNVKGQAHESQKHPWHGCFHFYECWLLQVMWNLASPINFGIASNTVYCTAYVWCLYLA